MVHTWVAVAAEPTTQIIRRAAVVYSTMEHTCHAEKNWHEERKAERQQLHYMNVVGSIYLLFKQSL
jgi:hypothetical protein